MLIVFIVFVRVINAILFLFFCNVLIGQNSNLVFLGNNYNKFNLFLDNDKFNKENFLQNAIIKDLSSENYSLKVIFENEDFGQINEKVFIENNTTYFFTFIKKEGETFNENKNNSYQLKLLSQIESNTFEEQLSLDNFNFDEILENNIAINLKSEPTAKKRDIKTNCIAPLSFKDFENIKLLIENEESEVEKTILVKKFIDKKCLSSQQLYFLLLNIKNESDKISIIKSCEYKIYNPEDLSLLTNLIKDPSIKSELKSLAYR